MRGVTTLATPVRGTPMTRYAVLLNGREIHAQLSALTDDDVVDAVRRHQEARRQAHAAPAPVKQERTLSCNYCHKAKPLAEFPRRADNRIRRTCRQCVRERVRAKRAAAG